MYYVIIMEHLKVILAKIMPNNRFWKVEKTLPCTKKITSIPLRGKKSWVPKIHIELKCDTFLYDLHKEKSILYQ